MKNFGVIVACYKRDYLFAKACCSSIKYFLGDVPICLIVDGFFSTKDLEKTYDAIVINRLNVKNEALRERSFGYGLTKMVAFWESPWENFLYLDADAMVWGNLSQFADFQHFDLIVDLPNYTHTAEEVSTWFFDVIEVEKSFPNFAWEDKNFFCTGVFFAKRNCLDLDRYISFLDLMNRNPKLFKCGEQGLLNLMIFLAAEEGGLKLDQKPIQTIVPDFSLKCLNERFPMKELKTRKCTNSTAMHWCGRKPFSLRKKVYSQPITYFRKKFLHDSRQYIPIYSDFWLQLEDFNVYKHKIF